MSCDMHVIDLCICMCLGCNNFIREYVVGDDIIIIIIIIAGSSNAIVAPL